MFTLGTYNQQDYTLNNAKALVGAKSLMDAFRFHTNNAVLLFKVSGLVLFVVAGLPLFYGFGFWLLYHRRKFLSRMKSSIEVQDLEDYLELKKGMNKMNELVPKLRNLREVDLKQVPLFFRFTVAQMKKFSSSLVTYQEWVESRLYKYNTPQFQTSSKVVKFTSENDLWEKRNPAYQYWM